MVFFLLLLFACYGGLGEGRFASPDPVPQNYMVSEPGLQDHMIAEASNVDHWERGPYYGEPRYYTSCKPAADHTGGYGLIGIVEFITGIAKMIFAVGALLFVPLILFKLFVLPLKLLLLLKLFLKAALLGPLLWRVISRMVRISGTRPRALGGCDSRLLCVLKAGYDLITDEANFTPANIEKCTQLVCSANDNSSSIFF